jgi:hypothetical protein
MKMADPWEDERAIQSDWETPDNANTVNAYVYSIGNLHLITAGLIRNNGALGRVLDDADKLLKSNRLLQEAVFELAHGKHSGRGYANDILSEASLPEHLK